jgi:CUB/sushi domain-containing protein
MTGVTVGSTATYTCNDNYQLMGASTRMCQPDGTWSGEEPMCIEIECPTLDDIPNGSVDITGVTVGSTATYTCNDNYQLKGASVELNKIGNFSK